MSTENGSKTIRELEAEIRELKSDLHKARTSEKRFLEALAHSPIALCHHDRDLKYTWLYNGHMGFVQDDVAGKTDWDILPEDLADRMGVVKRRVLETGIGERVEVPTATGDKNSEYFDLVVEPLKENGEIVGLSCSGIDVTEERRRREAYKASEKNLHFIFNASPMPILVTDFKKGCPLFFNKAADDIFRLSLWDEKKTGYEGVLDWLGVKQDVDRLFDRGQAILDYMFTFTDGEGRQFHMSLSATQIFYDGEVAVLSTLHDLTKEAEYQSHLEQTKEKAELASMAKSQFLASASHDLRQPLHAMGLLLSVLEQYVSDQDGLEVLTRVNTSLEAMNELFSGILDISKLDANAIAVDLQTVGINDVFDRLESDFTSEANDKGLDISFVASSLHVMSDSIQLERILRNLISNAIRYTDKGKILVGCRRTQDKAGIYVIDTGVGIAPEDQKIVFQEFRQIGNPERDRRKGLGLGLAICERVAHLLGSSLNLSSEKGKGSVFSLDLPIAESNCEAFDVERQAAGSLEGLRILVVEDEIEVQEASQIMLQSWGCQPVISGSVQEALAQLEQKQFQPDMIIADYRLRENETGLDAVLKIRSHLQWDVPALIVSGDTNPELIRKLEEHDLSFLSKPLMPRELRDRLNSLQKTVNS